eukprot:TRINITY_DN3619_c1_g2_i2.p1 TRINITY_DN3619_c1_g2~~TRINITY_DN3619_c1_g2_i2.p1  ORF type:complete len:195 (-),score=-9.91 TRINITY_DN3619_c1_g2_i2:419-1003(-)
MIQLFIVFCPNYIYFAKLQLGRINYCQNLINLIQYKLKFLLYYQKYQAFEYNISPTDNIINQNFNLSTIEQINQNYEKKYIQNPCLYQKKLKMLLKNSDIMKQQIKKKTFELQNIRNQRVFCETEVTRKPAISCPFLRIFLLPAPKQQLFRTLNFTPELLALLVSGFKEHFFIEMFQGTLVLVQMKIFAILKFS